ncbi:hypothetical protein PLICBS_006496 [Purpureocillium lilacinum]|uniref:uncharacterized protein n=1 Tax=Purpureocillium lilacinum TaxID=33203 RepID=UPI00207E41B8|nr:hypothetical protein PLICBS_006496 [Purpureocillium lilacinum]
MLAATRHDGRAVPDDTGAATATEKTSTMAEATAMNGSGSAPADEAQKTAPPLAAVASSNGGDGGSSVAKKRKKDGLKPIITKEGATGTDEDEDDEDETGRLDMRLAERRDQDQTRRAVQAIGSVSGHHQPPCWLA